MVLLEEENPLDAFFKSLSQSHEIQDVSVNLTEPDAGLLEDGSADAAVIIDRSFVEAPAFLVKPLEAHKELEPVDHSVIQYPPFRKSFYKETTEVADLTSEEVKELRFQMDQIKLRGLHCPKPIRSWSQCGFPLPILEGIRALGFANPTPIQAQALPTIMSGRDVIGIAKTGSGKTLAFVLPMLRHILDQAPPKVGEGPVALILTPTRELAMQTFSVVRYFSVRCGITGVVAYGGVDIKEQIASIRRQPPSVMVATPGRLIDLLLASGGKVINLRRITYVVLDEADRLFDLGFGPQVVRVVENIRPDKQAVLFSATFPKPMESLARKMLSKPVEIIAGQMRSVCNDVEQRVCLVDSADDKFVHLLVLLGETQSPKILIFVDRQLSVDLLIKDLRKRGHHGLALHGGMEQIDRDAAIADFRAGVFKILVATSIAARGLDVPDIDLVINYDAPNHLEDYIHRAGRTGRAGRKGLCVTILINPMDGKAAADLVRAFRASNLVVPVDLLTLTKRYEESLTEDARSRTNKNAGYGGRGLGRLDAERASLLEVQRTLYAPKAEVDESITPEDENQVTVADKGAANSGKKLITVITSPKPPPPRADLPPVVLKAYRASRAAAEVIELAIANRRQITQFQLYDPIALLNAKYKPLASGFGGEILPVYDQKAVLSYSMMAEGSQAMSSMYVEPRGYLCEIDVNDYPSPVRFRITQKDTLSGIIDAAGGSGVSLVVRGQYISPGKTPTEGERRLHIRIEGTHLPAVEFARSEIKRILLEAFPMAAGGFV